MLVFTHLHTRKIRFSRSYAYVMMTHHGLWLISFKDLGHPSEHFWWLQLQRSVHVIINHNDVHLFYFILRPIYEYIFCSCYYASKTAISIHLCLQRYVSNYCLFYCVKWALKCSVTFWFLKFHLKIQINVLL